MKMQTEYRKPIAIPHGNYTRVMAAFRNADPNYEHLSLWCDIGIQRTRDLVKELQLARYNPLIPVYGMLEKESDLKHYFPTLAQFPIDLRRKVVDCALRFPHSPTVQRNRIFRKIQCPVPIKTPSEIMLDLDIGRDVFYRWVKEFDNAMEYVDWNEDNLDHKKILAFTESCGIDQLTEIEDGSFRSAIWAYFGLKDPESLNEILTSEGPVAEAMTEAQMCMEMADKTNDEQFATLYKFQIAQLHEMIQLPDHVKKLVMQRIMSMIQDGYNAWDVQMKRVLSSMEDTDF